MKKILFLAVCSAFAVACTNSAPVDGTISNDSIDSVEVVDSVVDSLVVDSINID